MVVGSQIKEFKLAGCFANEMFYLDKTFQKLCDDLQLFIVQFVNQSLGTLKDTHNTNFVRFSSIGIFSTILSFLAFPSSVIRLDSNSSTITLALSLAFSL